MLTAYVRKMRLFSRNMRLCLIFIAIFGFCVFGIYFLLFNLYVLRLGYGPEYVGLVISAWGLLGAIASIPAGLLAGRIGSRRTMIVGACVGIAGYVAVLLGEALPRPTQGLWIGVWFALTGLGQGLLMTAIGPFMISATTTEEFDHAFASYTALLRLGGFLGSLTGGLLPGLFASLLGQSLDAPVPYRYPLLLAALLYLAGLGALVATREHRQGEVADAAPEQSRAPVSLITLVIVTMLLQHLAGSAAGTFFNVYMDTALAASAARIGLLAALAQLLSVPAPMIVPLLTSRWGRRSVIVVTALGTALSALPLALIPHWAAAGTGYVGSSVFMFMWVSVVFPYIMTLRSARWQATFSGAGILATGLGGSAAALGGGYIATALGFPSVFTISAALTTVGALLFWAYFRGPRGEPQPEVAGAENGPGR